MGGSHSAFSQFGLTAASSTPRSSADGADAAASSPPATRPIVGSGSSAFRPYAGAKFPRQASAGASAPASSQASSKGHEHVPIAASAADRGKRPMSEGSMIAAHLQLMASHASAEARGSQVGPAPVRIQRGVQPGAVHWTELRPQIGPDGMPIPRKAPAPASSAPAEGKAPRGHIGKQLLRKTPFQPGHLPWNYGKSVPWGAADPRTAPSDPNKRIRKERRGPDGLPLPRKKPGRKPKAAPPAASAASEPA